MKVHAIGLVEKAETPMEARERLHASVSWWLQRAQEAHDEERWDDAIDAITTALERARNLRHHLTGQVL